MPRVVTRFLLTAALLVSFASIASAAVHVRVAVSPSSIPLCSDGHFLFALGNDGTSPILAQLCFSLTRNGVPVLMPLCGRVPLAAGETRTREFDFLVPSIFPLGSYTLMVSAQGSDGSKDNSSTSFMIVPGSGGACPAASSLSPESDFMNGLAQTNGVQPEQPAPAKNPTWGQIKVIYR